jgi:hypothetical protein
LSAVSSAHPGRHEDFRTTASVLTAVTLTMLERDDSEQ